jgi:hypothetical protein
MAVSDTSCAFFLFPSLDPSTINRRALLLHASTHQAHLDANHGKNAVGGLSSEMNPDWVSSGEIKTWRALIEGSCARL